MSTANKLIAATSGTAGGGGLNVEQVFATNLYTGTGSSRSRTNYIDLAGEGGLVWFKRRNGSHEHGLYDTVRGTGKRLMTDQSGPQETDSNGLSAFNSDGFTVVSADDCNGNSDTYASWTFRKAPKFFDIVTYTGTGSAMTIDHNLGQVPGMIIVKSTSATYDWAVWHRQFTGTTDYIKLNTTAAKTDSASVFGNGSTYLTPTSTQFFVGGNNQVSGEVGGTYVAYLFAHNDSDGGFGSAGDQDIIKCGSYTGNGSTGNNVTLGFEPQWVLVRRADDAEDWTIYDAQRGGMVTTDVDATYLEPHDSAAESSHPNRMVVTPTGFMLNINDGRTNTSGGTYIYVAIRRGPMKTPENATDVFDITLASQDSTAIQTNLNVIDTTLQKDRTGSRFATQSRLTGNRNYIQLSSTTESTYPSDRPFDTMGKILPNTSDSSVSYSFKRSANFFDVVGYTGTGSSGLVVNHNLEVAPELLFIKNRDRSDAGWAVYYGTSANLFWNENAGAGLYYSNLVTSAGANSFTLGTGTDVNYSGDNHIAQMFATLAGVSKVGSYTGNGSSQTINCAFSSGARFVMIKRTDATGNWSVFDSDRGIASGNDPRLETNSASAEDTSGDYIDPDSSGFIVNFIADNNDDVNRNTANYIYLAIA